MVFFFTLYRFLRSHTNGRAIAIAAYLSLVHCPVACHPWPANLCIARLISGSPKCSHSWIAKSMIQLLSRILLLVLVLVTISFLDDVHKVFCWEGVCWSQAGLSSLCYQLITPRSNCIFAALACQSSSWLTTTYCGDQSRLRKVKRRSSSPHKLPNTLLTVAQLGGDEALLLSWSNSHGRQQQKNATNCHGWSTAMRNSKKGRSKMRGMELRFLAGVWGYLWVHRVQENASQLDHSGQISWEFWCLCGTIDRHA